MELIDLTRTFTANMPVYPGDPVPKFEKVADIGVEGYTDYKIETGMHVGTHMDAPMHMIKGGADLSVTPIHQFFGRGCFVEAVGTPSITAEHLQAAYPQAGDIVVVHTGHGATFGSDTYYVDYPVLDESFAQAAIEAKINIVCLDTPSPDHEPFTIHKMLLSAGILIVENLLIDERLTTTSFDVIALPAKLALEGAPVRVVAKLT